MCSNALGCGFDRRPISAHSLELLSVYAASALWDPASGRVPLFTVVTLFTDFFPSHFIAELCFPGGSQLHPHRRPHGTSSAKAKLLCELNTPACSSERLSWELPPSLAAICPVWKMGKANFLLSFQCLRCLSPLQD